MSKHVQKFEIIKCVDRPVMRAVHIKADNPEREGIVYLDRYTGAPMYPAEILFVKSGIKLVLASDINTMCSLPPSVSVSMIPVIIFHLNNISDTEKMIRKLINMEKQRLLSEEGDQEK